MGPLYLWKIKFVNLWDLETVWHPLKIPTPILASLKVLLKTVGVKYRRATTKRLLREFAEKDCRGDEK